MISFKLGLVLPIIIVNHPLHSGQRCAATTLVGPAAMQDEDITLTATMGYAP